MNYSVADAIASIGGDATSSRTGDISAILPYGIAPGAKAVMRKEKKAAEEAISTGIYVTWRSCKTGQDCARVGSLSRCFCGCSYEKHVFRKGYTLPVCRTCECQGFDFVPSRPEEIGEWWLPRRRGFDASSWRVKCRCGHSHEAHHASRRSCGSCKCGEFNSAYGCVVCESRQEDHQTQVETAQDRASAGRPVGRDFIPLSQSAHLSQLTFGRKPRSPAGLQPSESIANGTETGGGRGGSGAGGKTPGKGPPSSSSPSPMANGTRRGTRSSESSNVVRAGAGRYITARAASSGVPSPAAAPRQTTTVLSGQGERRLRLMRRAWSDLGASGRCESDAGGANDDFNSAKSSTSASPELLYASGRITVARYHEMVKEMESPGDRGGPGSPGAGATAAATNKSKLCWKRA